MAKTSQKSRRKSTSAFIYIVGTATLIIGILVAVFSTKSRFQAAADSVNYEKTQGRIVMTYSHQHEDSDDDTYYTYSADINFHVGSQEYFFETDDFYDSRPDDGDRVEVMYRESNPDDCYVAEKDWLTGKFIPAGKDSDMMIFLALFLFSFGFMLYGMQIGGKVGGSMLGIGLLLIGIGGVFVGITSHIYPMFILIVFGLAGVLVLYQTLCTSSGSSESKKSGKSAAKSELRLVIVKEIYADQNGLPSVVLFALMGNDGVEWYYSYRVDMGGKFTVGDKYMLDIAQIDMSAPTVPISVYTTTDISYLPQDAFQTLNRAFEILFSSIHA